MARIAWRFEDPVVGTVEFMEVNPNEGASPTYAKNLTKKSAVAPGGQVLLFEGNDQPRQFDFSGVILTEAQYTLLYEAWAKRHPILIVDDLGREFRVYMETFSPSRVVSGTNPWRHNYQATSVIVG